MACVEICFHGSVWVNDNRCFLDWGLMMMMIAVQGTEDGHEGGKWYPIICRIDEETNRIMASARIEKFLTTMCHLNIPAGEGSISSSRTKQTSLHVIINNLHGPGLCWSYDRIERTEDEELHQGGSRGNDRCKDQQYSHRPEYAVAKRISGTITTKPESLFSLPLQQEKHSSGPSGALS